MVRYLSQEQIDRKKWDACIMNSRQKLIYSLSWYLDLVATNWGGLVEGDYTSVMAIPWRKKFGLKYIYQPFYSQQLGIYSSTYPDAKKFLEFYQAIPSDFRHIEYNFNHLHNFQGVKNKITTRKNFELRLNTNYLDLFEKFSSNTQRNITKTLPTIELREGVKVGDIVKMKRENSALNLNAEFYENLNCLIHGVMLRKKGFIVGAYIGDKLVGSAFFAMNEGRIYYLTPVSNKEGKEKRAMFAILDYVIGKYADTGLILDFEGSQIPGVARFFAGFGAKPITYFHLKENRLPFPINLLKK